MAARLRARRPRRGEPRRSCSARSSASRPRTGVDKLTLIASPGIHDLGAWLEQLLAESTGKEGKGIIPVDREPLGAPDGLRRRSPVRLPAARGRARPAQDAAVAALEEAGKPVVRDPRRDHVRPRRGVLPLGDRDRGRGRGHRHQPVQPARRRGEQDRDARADQRVREDRERCRRRRRSSKARASSSSPTRKNADALEQAAGGRRRWPAI